MQALVTGAGGFVGGHLCAYLLDHTDWTVVGALRSPPAGEAVPQSRLHLAQAELRDPDATRALLSDFEADFVFHLAAESSVPASYSEPWTTLENNLRAELNVLEAARECAPSARVLVVGSNEEYGAPEPDGLPLTEESPLRPGSPYAVSKIAQDYLGLQYHLAYAMDVVRVRPFNHTGPGQSPRFVVPAFARQIARIEAGLQDPLMKVGNLEAERDFSDVRDIVRGYHLAVTRGTPGEVYILASGCSRPVRELLQTLLSGAKATVEVVIDPDLYRPVDVPRVYGSADKLRAAAGWEPRIPFEQTLADTLAYWRGKVRE